MSQCLRVIDHPIIAQDVRYELVESACLPADYESSIHQAFPGSRAGSSIRLAP